MSRPFHAPGFSIFDLIWFHNRMYLSRFPYKFSIPFPFKADYEVTFMWYLANTEANEQPVMIFVLNPYSNNIVKEQNANL